MEFISRRESRINKPTNENVCVVSVNSVMEAVKLDIET